MTVLDAELDRERPPGLPPGSRPARRLTLAMLAAGLSAFSLLYFTQALLPAIGAAFRVGPAASSLTVSCATGALALAILPLSSVAESVGRTRLMRGGLLVACVLAFASALMPRFWMLLFTRALIGVALAAVVAVAMGHLGDEIHPTGIGAAIGLYVSGNSLGGVLGRLIPGAAQDLGSWRLAVAVLAGCSAVMVAAFLVLLPPARRFQPTPARLGAHASALRELWRDPGVRRLCAVGFLLMGGFVACYNYLSYRLTSAPIGLSGTLASLLFLAYLAGTASSTVAGRLADRHGRRAVIGAGGVLSLAGLALTLPDNLAAITVGLVVFTAGFFVAHSVASGWMAARVSRYRAQASAMYLMAYYLGSSALGWAIGLAYLHSGWTATASVIGALCVAALVCVAGIPDRPRR
ncbi:MFS transporter [Rugosimonospora africana]|uniref:MFS transporter n=1 Tax=Rugosimonospora africana TaxID=556532 RepID=UPI001944376F|nr:MFS transporter [Rugosimonospora africana]